MQEECCGKKMCVLLDQVEKGSKRHKVKVGGRR
jgi:hypothetical protein